MSEDAKQKARQQLTPIVYELNGYEIYEHKTGQLRFAIWKDNEEICWCREFDVAVRIVGAFEQCASRWRSMRS